MIEGGYTYGHLRASQAKSVEEVMYKVVTELRPTKVLEIGTFHGGLTIMLRDFLDTGGLQNSIIRTYDTNEQVFLKKCVDKRTEIVTKNLFNKPYNGWKGPESEKEIKEFIDSGSPTLVLCDGGCKKWEFRLIAPLLKKGDVIMAHDYAPNREYFEEHIKGKIWDWLEIEDKHVADVVSEQNLSPYLQDLAQKAVWMSKIKE
jgi:cephalosporin hydroxylase